MLVFVTDGTGFDADAQTRGNPTNTSYMKNVSRTLLNWLWPILGRFPDGLLLFACVSTQAATTGWEVAMAVNPCSLSAAAQTLLTGRCQFFGKSAA